MVKDVRAILEGRRQLARCADAAANSKAKLIADLLLLPPGEVAGHDQILPATYDRTRGFLVHVAVVHAAVHPYLRGELLGGPGSDVHQALILALLYFATGDEKYNW